MSTATLVSHCFKEDRLHDSRLVGYMHHRMGVLGMVLMAMGKCVTHFGMRAIGYDCSHACSLGLGG